MTGPREGDVVSYIPDRRDRHCREGMAIVRDGQFVDTFWGSMSDAHVLTATEIATVGLIFNVGDYDELDQYDRSAHSTWERYARVNRARITSQHGLQSRYFIRKGASEDLPTQIGNARAKVYEAKSEVERAARRLESAEQQLATLVSRQGDLGHECANCAIDFAHQPVVDAEQVSWLGDKAPAFCSQACLEAAGERQATS